MVSQLDNVTAPELASLIGALAGMHAHLRWKVSERVPSVATCGACCTMLMRDSSLDPSFGCLPLGVCLFLWLQVLCSLLDHFKSLAVDASGADLVLVVQSLPALCEEYSAEHMARNRKYLLLVSCPSLQMPSLLFLHRKGLIADCVVQAACRHI